MAHLLTGARKALLSPAVVASAPPPAGDPIADPVYAGHSGGAATGNQRDVNISTTIPAGSTVQAIIVGRSALTSVTVTDSKGNTWGVAEFKAGGQAGRCYIAVAENIASALVSGVDYVRFATPDTSICVARVDFIPTGAVASPIDLNTTPVQGDGVSTISITTPALAQTNEIVFSINWFWENPGTYTPEAGFTPLTVAQYTTGEYYIMVDWLRPGSTAALTIDPTWTVTSGPMKSAGFARSYKGA